MATTAAKLALLGGEPAVTLDQIEAAQWPIVEEEEVAAAREVVQAGNWSTAPVTRQFEAEFAAYLGVPHALAHPNGTSALHAAYFSLGLGPGDEVIVPTRAPWFTAMPILNVGAIPVFADVDPLIGAIDPEDVARKITPRTKAITVLHVNGRPCDMDALLDLARQHGLKVVEDASLSHGASYYGRKIGSLGDVAAFSMQTSKLMPSGEGGVFVTNHQECYERAVLLGHYERIGGLSKEEDQRFQHTGYGFKYRISPINAAIARVSLRKLDERNRRRNENVHYLLNGLAEVPSLTPEPIPDQAHIMRTYYHGPWVGYDAAELGGLPMERLVEALRAEGVNARPVLPRPNPIGLHVQPMFVERKHWAFAHPANAASMRHVCYGEGTLPVAENPPRNRFMVPAFPRASRALLDQYIGAAQKVARHAGELL